LVSSIPWNIELSVINYCIHVRLSSIPVNFSGIGRYHIYLNVEQGLFPNLSANKFGVAL